MFVSQLHHSPACFIIFHEYEWSSCDPHEYQTNSLGFLFLSWSSSSLSWLLQQEVDWRCSSTHDARGEVFTVTVVLVVEEQLKDDGGCWQCLKAWTWWSVYISVSLSLCFLSFLCMRPEKHLDWNSLKPSEVVSALFLCSISLFLHGQNSDKLTSTTRKFLRWKMSSFTSSKSTEKSTVLLCYCYISTIWQCHVIILAKIIPIND